MPIVTSKILTIINKQGGARAIYEEHTDHLGIVHDHRYTDGVGGDETAAMAAWAANFDAYIVDVEKQEVKGHIRAGDDPARIAIKYLNNAQKARMFIRGVMSMDDPPLMLKAIQYISANITLAQMRALFTNAQATRIKARVDAIMTNATFLQNDQSRIEEI